MIDGSNKKTKQDKKKFHDAMKTIYGPMAPGDTTLLSADERSTLLTDKKTFLESWAAHCNSEFNRKSSINDKTIQVGDSNLLWLSCECRLLSHED